MLTFQQILPLAVMFRIGTGASLLSNIVFLLAWLGFVATFLWLIADALTALPREARLIEPPLVYLGLIPLFHLVWIFFITSRAAGSFRRYFEATGRPQPGDYGAGVGLGWSICIVLCIIPCVNCFALPAALTCGVLFVVKMRSLKSLALHGAPGGFEVLSPGSYSQAPARPAQVPPPIPTDRPLPPSGPSQQ